MCATERGGAADVSRRAGDGVAPPARAYALALETEQPRLRAVAISNSASAMVLAGNGCVGEERERGVMAVPMSSYSLGLCVARARFERENGFVSTPSRTRVAGWRARVAAAWREPPREEKSSGPLQARRLQPTYAFAQSLLITPHRTLTRSSLRAPRAPRPRARPSLSLSPSLAPRNQTLRVSVSARAGQR